MVFLVVVILALFAGQATSILPTKTMPTKTTMTWDNPIAKSFSVTKTKTNPNASMTAAGIDAKETPTLQNSPIVVYSITWCGKSYTPREWKGVKSGYWNGKCPESVE